MLEMAERRERPFPDGSTQSPPNSAGRGTDGAPPAALDSLALRTAKLTRTHACGTRVPMAAPRTRVEGVVLRYLETERPRTPERPPPPVGTRRSYTAHAVAPSRGLIMSLLGLVLSLWLLSPSVFSRALLAGL